MECPTAPAKSLLRHCLGSISPGVPVVLCGPFGSGRSVMTLELLAEHLGSGARAVLLTADPPRLVMDQARSLGLDLEAHLREERFVLLELAADASNLLFSNGAPALRVALSEASAGATLVVIDPVTALVSEFLDERDLRSLVRELFEGAASAGQAALLTCGRESLDSLPLFERVLKEVCGAWVSLRIEDGRRVLHVDNARLAGARSETIAFEIVPGGTRILAPAAEPARPPAARPGEAPPQPAASPGAEPLRRRKILVVEDDRLLRTMYQDVLRDRYDVVTVEDGFAALTAVLRDHPDLLVLDLQLPRVSGFEVLRALRGTSSRIPVLVVSSAMRASDRLRALVLGAADVMSKPVPRFELLHKIESLLLQAEPSSIAYDSEDAEALLDVEGRTRLLEAGEFGDRVARAWRFGREFGVESVLLLMQARSVEARDALLGAAESTLRAEDALFAVDKERLAALLLCCEPVHVEGVLARFGAGVESRGASARDLRYRARPISAWNPDEPLEGGFGELRSLPALPPR